MRSEPLYSVNKYFGIRYCALNYSLILGVFVEVQVVGIKTVMQPANKGFAEFLRQVMCNSSLLRVIVRSPSPVLADGRQGVLRGPALH